MSREFTDAEEGIVKALAAANPDGLRTLVDRLVPPTNMVSVDASIAPTTAITETSVTIPASCQPVPLEGLNSSALVVGQAYSQGGEFFGRYLGQFDLGNGVGEKPIFVLEPTKENMTFVDTVKAQGKLPNSYVADPYEYDANQGLREGKTAIATFDMVWAAYQNQNKFHVKGNNGKLQKMFKDAGWILSSSPHPGHPSSVRLVDFRGGDDDWSNKDDGRAPSVLVRTALTL
ncbi:MAG: hypothetical protein HGA87_05055 [Desulfobulbaceae bacterium]|nr:hypothetical protein [Desulfobulbaceae bacterium]